jgi:hypothetical protein
MQQYSCRTSTVLAGGYRSPVHTSTALAGGYRSPVHTSTALAGGYRSPVQSIDPYSHRLESVDPEPYIY